MKPLLPTVVAACLILAAIAHPENIEDIKELPETQNKEIILEAEESSPQARIERCTTCSPSLKLKQFSPNEILGALRNLPPGEVHSEQSFEGCSTEKGCAGIKVKDGKIIQKFGNTDAFNAAAAANNGNEFSFHAAGNLGDLPFWWLNENSPFKNTGNYENYSSKTSTSSFSSSGNGAAAGEGAGAFSGSFDIAANPFLNGNFPKFAGSYGSAVAQNGNGSPSFQSSSFDSSSSSTSTRGDLDLSNNPFLNGGVSKFGSGGIQGQVGYGSGQTQGQSGYSSSKTTSGYVGSSPRPFAPNTASNVNFVQTTQKAEYDYDSQSDIDERFQDGEPCSNQGYVCALRSQCVNGVVSANAVPLLQTKTKKQFCDSRSEVCCRFEVSTSSGVNGIQGSYGVSSSTYSGSASTASNSYGTSNQGFGNAGSPQIGYGTYSGSATGGSNAYGTSNKGSGVTGASQPGRGSYSGSVTTTSNSFGTSNQGSGIAGSSQSGYGTYSGSASSGSNSFGTSNQGFGTAGTSQTGYGINSGSTTRGSNSFGTSNQGSGTAGTTQTGYGAYSGTATTASNSFGTTNRGSGAVGSSQSGYGTSTTTGNFGNKGTYGQGTKRVQTTQSNFASTTSGTYGADSSNRGVTAASNYDASKGSFNNQYGSTFGASSGTTLSGSFGTTPSSVSTKQVSTTGHFSNKGTSYRGSSQSNFIESDTFSAGSNSAGVYRPGASSLKPGVPYLPPDHSNAGSNIVTSTAFPPSTLGSTPRPIGTPKPQRPNGGSGYLPPPIGESSNQRETIVPKPPSYNEGQIILDENRYPRPKPVATPTPGPVHIDIPVGCAAALKCTPLEFCTAEGMISNTTVVLSRDQQTFRVPLTDCKDLETGLIGKCCRDPYYTDPWPTNQLGKWVEGVFGGNDGKYVPDSKGSPNFLRPQVTSPSPVTGSLYLNNFRNPSSTTPTPLGPNQITPGYSGTTVVQGSYNKYGIRQGQGQYGQKGQFGQGSTGVGNQGQIGQRGQGQFNQGQYGSAGQGQVTQAQGQYGRGTQYTQTTQSYGQTQFTQKGQGQGQYSQGEGQYGQGQLEVQGQGSQSQFTQVQKGIQGQGQIIKQGEGQIITQGQGVGVSQDQGVSVITGQGQGVRQGTGYGVIQGQGVSGEGQIVSHEQGLSISQTRGQGVITGQGQIITQGQGVGVTQSQDTIGQGTSVTRGEGQIFTQEQGFGVTQTRGQGVITGQGQIVTQGQGGSITQGKGQIITQGQGLGVNQGFGVTQSSFDVTQGIVRGDGDIVTPEQGVTDRPNYDILKGQGQIITQGQGQGIITGQGQTISQGFGAGITQGQGVSVSQGGGYEVENEASESMQRVFLKEYNAGGQCGLLNNQRPYGNRNELEVDFAEIPWQAMVLLQTNRSLLCGGVITRPDVVVTSAACVEGLEAKNVLIKGGEWKLGIDEEPLPFQIVQVKHILRHPFFQPGNLHFDAAILVLEEDLRLAKNIYPICLPGVQETLDAFYNGAGQCIVTGWGKIVLQAHIAGAIMHGMNVSLINPGECQARLSQDYPHLLEQYDEESCVCGQPSNPLDNICRVDIGSAMACTTGDGHFVLRGVYSWDSGCQVGNQLAAFNKFDMEWYNWAIGLIETTRFSQYAITTHLTQNRYTGQVNTGIKGAIGGSGGFSLGGQFGFGQGQLNLIPNFGQIKGQGQLSNQFGQYSSKYTQEKSETNSDINKESPLSNTYTATYSEKKVYQSEPKIISYTTKPEIVTFTTKPEIFTFTTKPKIVTYTTKPEIFTYTTKPKIISYTTKPEIISYTTKPQFISYVGSATNEHPQYVIPGVSYNPSFTEVASGHKHSAQCKCLEGKK